MQILSLFLFLWYVPELVVGDLTGTDPPTRSCLCTSDTNVIIRATPCGEVLNIENQIRCSSYRGNREECILMGESAEFYNVEYLNGWVLGSFLNTSPLNNCTMYPVKLVNDLNSNENEGRLEIFYDDQWGTVCDDYWNDGFVDGNITAGVACRSLGLQYNRGYSGPKPCPDPGDDPIWLDNVQCGGVETSIVDCYHLPWGVNDCGHDEDVWLYCRWQNFTQAAPTRLVNNVNDNPHEGRLEIFHEGVWGTVCDDYWNDGHRMENVTATIACKSISEDYTQGYAKEEPTLELGVGQIWLDDVYCIGDGEPGIDQCEHRPWGIHDCAHFEDVWLYCS